MQKRECSCRRGNSTTDAPSLKIFDFFSSASKVPCFIDFKPSTGLNLKTLNIDGSAITSHLLNSYLSRFPLLEDVFIVRCPMLERIVIPSLHLKSLKIYRCSKIEAIQVDSPNLSRFECHGCNMPIIFPEDGIPCPLDLTLYINGRVHRSWFLDLRRFLFGLPTRRTLLRLIFQENHRQSHSVHFDLEEFGEVDIPSQVEVDQLKIQSNLVRESEDCVTLIDGLLWSCHPKTISIHSNSRYEKDCIQVLCEKLFEREDHSSCCGSSRKCWRHSVKDAKIEKFGGVDDKRLLQWRHLLDTYTFASLGRRHEVRLNLEWYQ